MSSSKETGAANNNGEETGDGRGAPESSGSNPAPPLQQTRSISTLQVRWVR
jgi:hypothetical protein